MSTHESRLSGTLWRHLEAQRLSPASQGSPIGEVALRPSEREAFFSAMRAEIADYPDLETFVAKLHPIFTGPPLATGERTGAAIGLYDDWQTYGPMSSDGSFPAGGHAERTRLDKSIVRPVLVPLRQWLKSQPKTTNMLVNMSNQPGWAVLAYRFMPTLLDATGKCCHATYAVPVRQETADAFMARVREDSSYADELFARSSFAQLFRPEDGVAREPAQALAMLNVPLEFYRNNYPNFQARTLLDGCKIEECNAPAYVSPVA